MKKSILLALAWCTAQVSLAQTNEITTQQKDRKVQHQVGVQLNELIRQVFNFNGNASTNTNPYLATYSLNLAKTGWGLRLGVGYNYQSFTTEDGITGRTSNIDDLRARLGFEKSFRLSDKWSAGVGLDGVVNYDKNNTKSVTRGFDTVTTVTSSSLSSYGGGAMTWLRYNITSRILIGTEASYYYSTGQQKEDIAITRRDFTGGGGGQLETTITRVDNKQSEGKLSVPIAFFLIVQF